MMHRRQKIMKHGGQIIGYFRRSRRFPFAAAAVMAIAFVLAGEAVLADITDSYSYENKLETGIVRVGIENYMISGGKTVPAEKRNVMPNERVSLVPRVTNRGAEAYIRVRFSMSSSAVSEDDIYGLGRLWIKKGDYLYLRDPLPQDGAADVFEGIHIPEEADKRGLKEFSVTGYADAVQSRNFSPDYSSDDPWGDVDVSKSKNENCNAFTSAERKEEYLLLYEDDGFHGDTENLFEGFSVRFDGDSESGELRISNISGSDIRVSFLSSAAGNILSNRMTAKVSCGSEMLYDGRISDMGDSDIKVISLRDGEERVLEYEIGLPEKSGNLYTNLNETVRWTFRAERTGGIGKIIQTGDIAGIGLLLLLGAAAAVSAAVGYILRRNVKRNGSCKQDIEDN